MPSAIQISIMQSYLRSPYTSIKCNTEKREEKIDYIQHINEYMAELKDRRKRPFLTMAMACPSYTWGRNDRLSYYLSRGHSQSQLLPYKWDSSPSLCRMCTSVNTFAAREQSLYLNCIEEALRMYPFCPFINRALDLTRNTASCLTENIQTYYRYTLTVFWDSRKGIIWNLCVPERRWKNT